MRSVVCTAFGTEDNFVVEEGPTPDPAPGQVRVAVKAAGASFVDVLQAAGKYQFAAQPPYVPGGEAAGVIDALGDGVEGWEVGDRVSSSRWARAPSWTTSFVAPATADTAPRRDRPRRRGIVHAGLRHGVVRVHEADDGAARRGRPRHRCRRGRGPRRDRRGPLTRRTGDRGGVLRRQARARDRDGRRGRDRSAHRGHQDTSARADRRSRCRPGLRRRRGRDVRAGVAGAALRWSLPRDRISRRHREGALEPRAP